MIGDNWSLAYYRSSISWEWRVSGSVHKKLDNEQSLATHVGVW
jgi:hypothetical protein